MRRDVADFETMLKEIATALGELLVTSGIGLVYGGACKGLMGVIADTVLAGGGESADGIGRGGSSSSIRGVYVKE